MSSPEHSCAAEAFRSAVASGDFDSARTALDRYAEWVRSSPCSVAGIAEARDFIESGLRVVAARRGDLARDLARLTHFDCGYRPPRASNTWQIRG